MNQFNNITMKKVLIMAATVFMLTGTACTLSTKSDDQKEKSDTTEISIVKDDSLASQMDQGNVQEVENAD